MKTTIKWTYVPRWATWTLVSVLALTGCVADAASVSSSSTSAAATAAHTSTPDS